MVTLLGYGEEDMCHWRGVVDPVTVPYAEVEYLEPAQSSCIKPSLKGFMAVVRPKNTSPTWNDVRTALLDFDCAGLRGLVRDLYIANKDNQAFLHARLGLGQDQIQPFKASISRSICPDLIKGQPIS